MPRKLFRIAALLALTSAPVAAAEPAPPFSSQSTASSLCAPNPELQAVPECETGEHLKLNAALGEAFAAALKSSTGLAGMLLKRDQAWHIELLNQEDPRRYAGSDEDRTAHRDTARTLIEQRIKDLTAIAAAPKSSALAGRWVNTFGTISLEEAANGAMSASLEANPVYGPFPGRERCAFKADLTANSGWHEGEVLVITPEGEAKVAGLPYEDAPSHRIRLIRQGDTLRAIDDGNFECGAFTGTYFRANSEKAGAAGPKSTAAPLVSPSFDCTKPSTATDEEICADPDLANADVRLNRAWKANFDKFKGNAKTALKDDQRAFVRALGAVYVYHLHPYWNKQEQDRYHVDGARLALAGFMTERITILEGLEPDRKGWNGTWISNDTMVKIKVADNDTPSVTGIKWEHGDYKSGCDLTMDLKKDGTGIIPKGEDVPADLQAHAGQANGLKVTRDGQMLVISGKAAFDDGSVCRRGLEAPGPVFPVKDSPDLMAKEVMR